MLGLVALLAANLPRNELNDVFLRYFAPSISFRSDTDFTVANLTGLYTINFSLGSGASGGINEPVFQRDVEAFARWAERQPEVVHVDRYTRILSRLNRNLHGDDPAFERLPDDREMSAQYLLLYEMSLPYGLDLNHQINVDKSSTKVAVTTRILSSNEMLAFEARAHAWLRDHAPAVTSRVSAGTALMFAYIGQRNIKSMLAGTVVAIVPVALLLTVAFRSLRYGLISLVPNLVPAVMAFGLWGMTVGEVGLSLSVVTNMTFGIVIDDTVHFLSKYLRAVREHAMAPAAAVRYAFRTVGTALAATTAILVAGFLVLATSSFELNAGMGLMTALIIALALVADCCLLPPLLMRLAPARAN
jgi:predicted RND superfamily exporter protein